MMATSTPLDFVELMPKVARRLLGKPNEAMSNAHNLRFRGKGSMAVNLDDGTFYDHEAQRGGGVLDLIQHIEGGDKAAALGWLQKEGFKEPQQEKVWQLGAGVKRSSFYDYADEHGEVRYRVERIENGDVRDFRQHGPNGRGGFHAVKDCMKGVTPLPYRLPELIAADPSLPVFICEGEKDVDRLISAGLVATTNSGGGGNWKPELNQWLRGRQCVALQDNDEKGAKHVATVKAQLTGVAAEVATLKLPDLPEKGDVSDWLDAGNSVEELQRLAAEALANPPPLEGIRATPYQWREPSSLPQRQWIYGRYLLRGTVTAVIAPGGIGKTTLLSGVALSLVTARMLLGKAIWEGKQRVWIWNLEDDLDELSRSIQASAKHFEVTKEDVTDRLLVDSAMEGSTLCTAIEDQAGFKLLVPIFDAITAELIARKVDVLIIDPFVSSHEVDENANSKIDKIAKAWARVAKAANCAIILVHHTSKAGAGEVTALSARGAVALVNACRSALVLNRMDPETAAKFGIEDDQERRRYFSLQDDKHNRAPAENADWYRLASVSLGNGNMIDDEGDSVGVAEPWSPPDAFDGLTGQHLYRVQIAVADGAWREDFRSNDWVGHAVANVLGLDSSDKAHRTRIQRLIKTWLAEGALKVVEALNDARQKKRFVEVGRWQNDQSATLTPTVAAHTVAPEQSTATLQSSPLGEVL